MVSKISLATLLVMLMFGFSTSFSQEAKEVKKEEKKALYQGTCDPRCGYMVRSHDEAEVIDAVRTHTKRAHNMEMTDKDARARVKPVAERGMKEEMKKEVIKEEKKMY